MIKQIIDLHIHSKYSRACSKDLELSKIAKACKEKGIDIVATGDFTHPFWFEHIQENLVEYSEGIYVLKSQITNNKLQKNNELQNPNIKFNPTKFILSTEISCIYKDKGKCRRLHLIIMAPSIECIAKFNKELENRGVNLKSDGRPIMGLSAKTILEIMLEIDDQMMMIPAHAWTPWFAIFGSKSGYDSLEECFEELTPHIKAIETGLSSDPIMNRCLSKLDNITLVSNSDAHSPFNLGREANVFQFDDEKEINYLEIKRIIEQGDKKKFLYTIEFYPEEGKYHADGHLDCNFSCDPMRTKKENYLCPICKKKLTVGVLHRVNDLADRDERKIIKNKFIPHKYIVPLRETIAFVFGCGIRTKKVEVQYQNLIKNVGNEFYVLIDAPLKKIYEFVSNKNILKAIKNIREGKVQAIAGYDGKFGIINVLPKGAKDLQQTTLL